MLYTCLQLGRIIKNLLVLLVSITYKLLATFRQSNLLAMRINTLKTRILKEIARRKTAPAHGHKVFVSVHDKKTPKSYSEFDYLIRVHPKFRRQAKQEAQKNG